MSEMTSSLLLVTWLDTTSNEVITSFRYASGYTAPAMYKGNATLSQISKTVNSTHYELTYRCEDCWTWDQAGATGSQVPATTSGAAQLIGWAQATNAPTNPGQSDSAIQQHANDNIFGAVVASARNTAYTSWTSLATKTASSSGSSSTGNSTGSASASGTGSAASAAATATATAAACPRNNTLADSTWDYIIVGAGAGGIPLADRLSESGASVLLIEKGPPSSGRWGGTLKPDWLIGTNLSRFDVPGLDNEIWENSDGISCSDYSVMAGCVLGGGTAVNAGLWWRANPADFDYNFPTGWKSNDMEAAIGRAFNRIPFTEFPSTDGKLYKPCGWDIVGGALSKSGWEEVVADDVPAKKNWTYSRKLFDSLLIEDTADRHSRSQRDVQPR
jgi:cellobiose dehydrogenase (acceptor)